MTNFSGGNGLSRTKNLAICALFVTLIIAGGFIKIPIPAIPFTLQFLFTFMSVAIQGKKWGTASIVIYILLGLIGIPVFTQGGGLGYVLIPSFGYLIGFAIGGFLAGVILDKVKIKNFKSYMFAGVINLVIVYFCGMLYYYLLATFYLGKTVKFGSLIISFCLIFIPGDVLSMIIASILAVKLKKIIGYTY